MNSPPEESAPVGFSLRRLKLACLGQGGHINQNIKTSEDSSAPLIQTEKARAGSQAPTGATAEKIKELGELAALLNDSRASGRRIVHCHGVFDLLHIGHIRHFEAVNAWPTGVETIKLLRPHVFAKGQEFRDGPDITGAIAQEEEAILSVGGR